MQTTKSYCTFEEILNSHEDHVYKFAVVEGLKIQMAKLKTQFMATCFNAEGQKFWLVSSGECEIKVYKVREPRPRITIKIKLPTKPTADTSTVNLDNKNKHPVKPKLEIEDNNGGKSRVKPTSVDKVAPPNKKNKQENEKKSKIEENADKETELRRSKRIRIKTGTE